MHFFYLSLLGGDESSFGEQATFLLLLLTVLVDLESHVWSELDKG